MTTGMNLWDGDVWSFVAAMAILFGAMIVANTLRNTIRPLRRLMIPSAVLGGFIMLLVGYVYKRITGNAMLNTAMLELITYHGLGLGFVAMALRNTENKPDNSRRRGGFECGVTVVSGYLMQAILGLAVSIVLYKTVGSFFASGLLLPMGYGQGPGNAYSWGRVYESSYGFVGGTSFGLTVAAMGFVAASVGGVIYLNRLRRKGVISDISDGLVRDEHMTSDSITGGNEIPLTEAMDKFTIQLALVFLAYMMAYLTMFGINKVVETGVLGGFGATLQNTIWPFNFLLGTLYALLLKKILSALMKRGVIHREYTNDFMQNRISGLMFDLMVVASIAAIDLSAFSRAEFVLPLAVMCAAGATATYAYLNFICKRLYSDYRHEAFLSLYGMQTGTASTGVILLREVDPRLQSVAATNLVYHQPWAIVFGFPMLLLLGVAPKGLGNTFMTLGVLAALFAVMNIIAFRKQLFRRKKK